MIHWVKLKKYCELSGETRNTVNAKLANQIWREGYHTKVLEDGCRWINLSRVQEWAEHGQRKH